jgi:hypothetical protein
MTNDIFSNEIKTGDVVVFATTGHRGKRVRQYSGRVTKIHPSGKLTVQKNTAEDITITSGLKLWTTATGGLTVITAKTVVKW